MKRIFTFVFILCLCCSCLPIFSTTAYEDDKELAIVFTHDLHSHIDPFSFNGEDIGGFSRIKTHIDSIKADYENTVVVDAGDFSMGTLYQSIFKTSGAEYSLLGKMGYDAVCFGNHEFDYGFDGISNMVHSAKSNSSPLPPILSANINASASGMSDSILTDINVCDYTIKTFGDIKVAIFGLLGSDAVSLSGDSNLVFEDYIESAKSTVSEIKSLHSPDVIICLSHSGTGDTVNDEDIKLAKDVPDIDVIISGHTHTYLEDPILVGDTIIGSCGEYGKYVGSIILDLYNNNSLITYKLTKIGSDISADDNIELEIEKYKNDISKYLNQFGYESADQILAYSPFDFPEQEVMSNNLMEHQLGNLISDSYVHAFKLAEGDNYVPIDVSVAPAGVIRASIDKGNVTVAQAFEISSLGIGLDGVAGYPLCSVYLYGYELWNLAEVDASVSLIMPYAQLFCSGMNYSINTNRMFLNRVYDCWLVDKDGNRVEIEDNKLYRVVSGLSSAKLLGTVKSKSFGLLEITPKDANGDPIEDLDSFIAKDSNGAEIKEWKALADYLASFAKDANGTPTVPERYISIEGRKSINSNFSLGQMFISWNKVSWIIFFAIIIVISIITFIVLVLIKRKNKKKKAAILNNIG